MRSRPSPARPTGALLALALLLLGCGSEATAPLPGPPYLAIVSLFDQPPTPDVAAGMAYRVRDLIGTALDTVIRVPPADTVILPVEPSTYRVELTGLPPRCLPRAGTVRDVVLLPEYNTGIARFVVNCLPSLGLAAYAFGPMTDSAFVYRLRHLALGTLIEGVVQAGDTIYLTPLEPGGYEATLGHVSANCVVVSPDGVRQRVEVPEGGGPLISFSVNCSDPAHRPRIVLAHATYANGRLGAVIRAVDPDRDLRRFFYTITDCAGRSLLGSAATDLGFSSGRGTADTASVLVATEIGLSDDTFAGGCLLARVSDDRQNVSIPLEVPLGPVGGAPAATNLSVVVLGESPLRVQVAVADPDADYLGVVVAARVRDGVLRPPDGRDDYLLWRSDGYLGTAVPDLPLGAPYPRVYDLVSVRVALLDRGGNLTVYDDADFTQ